MLGLSSTDSHGVEGTELPRAGQRAALFGHITSSSLKMAGGPEHLTAEK